MVFWAIMVIGMPLLELVLLFGVGYTLKRVRLSGILGFIRDFLFVKAERRVFYEFLGAMALVVGFPWAIDLTFQYVTPESSIYAWVQLANDNPITVSIIYLAGITIGYAIYAYIIVNRNKDKYSKEIIKGLAVVNKEFTFTPNQQWFVRQASDKIKELGKRYDKEHNLRHSQLSFILSVLERDLSKRDNWIDDVEMLIDKCYQLADKCSEETKNEINTHLETLIDIVNTREWKEDDVRKFISTIETIGDLFSKWHGALSNPDRDHSSYVWNQYTPEISKFLEIVRSPWIECMYKQVMLVKGPCGIGKSHLLGNIVDERIQQGKPTILLMGSDFWNGPDPWNQIKTMLDVLCKKETFLTSLNAYAEETGERIQIVIDAINEGRAGRDYWADKINSLVNEVSIYPNIGIVLSVRTMHNRSRLDDYIEDTAHATYEAPGFTENLALACEYMFDSFGLPTPSWAVIDGMFAKPMWLHMYCVSHVKLEQTSERENHWQITEQYIEGFDVDLAKKFQYAKDRQLLKQVLFAIADKMIADKKTLYLSFKDAYDAVSDSIGTELKAKDYFDELLQIGILRQSRYRDESIIQFEYESFGHYVIVYRLISKYTAPQWNVYFWKLTHEMTEIVPLIIGRELFTYHEDDGLIRVCQDAFKETLPFRTTLTESGIQFLNQVWEAKDNEWMFDVIGRCATNPQIAFNAKQLHALLYDMPTMDRDALWTTKISEWYDTNDIHEFLNNYAKWTMDASKKIIDALNPDVAELLGEALIWCLCSTRGQLRDTATKGLVKLLRHKKDILARFVTKYYAINDLYVTERLWGVAFGCCTQNGELEYVEEIALLAKQYVFDQTPIVEHILITDYARLIIEYAIHLGSKRFDGYAKHLPPYNTYQSIPVYSDTYIENTYDKPYGAQADERIKWSALSLLDSMAVEYSRRGTGGYGDFGRYVFQYSLDIFPEDPNLLSNWGVEMIFKDFGYDPEKVKWFDSQSTRFDTPDRERIGKKYQWLALYRIAAVLSDYHTTNGGTKEDEEPSIYALRNIDPTLLKADAYRVKELKGLRYVLPSYGYEKIENTRWLQSPKHIPDMKQLLKQKSEGESMVTLHTYAEYTLRKERFALGNRNREFWCMLQSCFVDKRKASKAIKMIHKCGIAGREFSENREIYHIYAGEWYWSHNYKEYVIDGGYEQKEMRISFEYFDDILIRPTMIEYTHEYHYDKSSEDGDTIYLPNSHIVQTLELKLYDSRGIWTNVGGEIVMFDNDITGGKHALVIKEETLLEYLKKTGQVIIWPILIEKRVRNWRRRAFDEHFRNFQCGGYAVMNSRGKIKYKIRQYDEIPSRAKVFADKHIKPIVASVSRGMRNIGVKLKLVKLPEDKWMDYRIEEAIKKIKEGI